jgi:hypothetical protein
MNGRRIAGLVVGLLVLAGSALGQEGDHSRYRLPDRPVTTGDLDAMLKRRQLQMENNEQARKLLESLLQNRPASDELRNLQQLLKGNDELRKLVEKQLVQPDLRKTIDDLQKQKFLTRNQVGDLIGKLKIPFDRLPPALQKIVPPEPIAIENPGPIFPPMPIPSKDGPPEVRPPDPPRLAPLPPSPPIPPETTTEWFRKQADAWAGSFVKGIGSLDNETLKGFVEALHRNGVMPGKLEIPDWLKNSASGLPNTLKGWLPEMGPPPQLGNISFGNWSVGTPDMPTLPSAESAGKSFGFLFLLLLLGLAAWVLWQTRGLGTFGPTTEESRRLGPWPVSPDRVATRGELVLAFEYLARKILGLPAETCHHHEVARQLAQRAATSQQQDAAADLATLYEQARYTPPAETLSPEELARARQALRLLAPVARARGSAAERGSPERIDMVNAA